MNPQGQFSEEQRHQAAGQQAQSSEAREFANAEEMLRYDAARTPVPPEIAQRLQKSAAALPRPRTSWWKRLWGGGND